jgi:hypothetical protein
MHLTQIAFQAFTILVLDEISRAASSCCRTYQVEFSIFAEWQQNLTIGQENVLCIAKTEPLKQMGLYKFHRNAA